MWRNVFTNFLILSSIVFSGEYIRYQIESQNTPEKETVNIEFDISGNMNKTYAPVVISGAPQPQNKKTFHISGN